MQRYRDQKYQDRLFVAWKKFIAQQPYDYSFIRPEIFESWQMSRYYKVDPFHKEHHKLSEAEMKVHDELHSTLLKVAAREMDNLYSLIAGSNVYIVLTDNTGLTLYALGDERNLEISGPHTRMVRGASWALPETGTNSAAMCLALKQPIQVYGHEHYKNYYDTYTCSAAPIRDQKGELIATINLSSFNAEVTPHTLGMVTNGASAIENSLKSEMLGQELLRLKNMGSALNTGQISQTGIVLLDGDSRIIHVNETALAFLTLQGLNVTGEHVFNVIKIEMHDAPQGFQFANFSDGLVEMECNIHSLNVQTKALHALLSIHYVRDANERPLIAVLTITPVLHRREAASGQRQAHPQEFHTRYQFDDIIGSSHAMAKVIAEGKTAARVNSNVLLLGESGTGKEVFAHAIHSASNRRDRPFVAINCGAIPKTLVESELFGYEKGAFTGAKKEGAPGKFEQANGGTIFLDEIGEMPLDIQVALLRVLETRQVVRVGGTKLIDLNVRIIAATNKDLYREAMEKRFREDLFYRLGVFLINIPPLRKRGDDVIELAHYFAKRHSANNKAPLIHDEVHRALAAHSWPGNVRELSNVMERAVFIAENDFIQLKDLALFYNMHENAPSVQPDPLPQPHVKRSSGEAAIIENALRTHKGNVEVAAFHLDITARTLYRHLKKHNINPKDFKH